jgi:hypothetical protein
MVMLTLALFHKLTASKNIVCATVALKYLFKSAASATKVKAFAPTASANTISVAPAVEPNFKPPVIALAVVFWMKISRIIALLGSVKLPAEVCAKLWAF